MEAFGVMAGLVTAPRTERVEASVTVAARQTLSGRPPSHARGDGGRLRMGGSWC
jgi:hypothetical protein